ncbi:MAG: HAD-IC family P-type ATPase, partial [Candidatus Odinarchaeota archaeon]
MAIINEKKSIWNKKKRRFSQNLANSTLNGYNQELTALVNEIGGNTSSGLSSEQVHQLQLAYGKNVLPKANQNFWKVYISPLFNKLITVYLVMSIAILGLGIVALLVDSSNGSIWITASQWIVIVTVNIIIALVQQMRAQKKLDALQKLTATKATVIRDHKEAEILAEELVPGDLILLKQGDKIPADARIIQATSLLVNEASLTGESQPALKVDSGEIYYTSDIAISEQHNMIFSGTFVVAGKARAIVVNTGCNTEFGQISAQLNELNTGDIPIRQKINEVGDYLIILMVAVFGILFFYQSLLLLQKISITDPSFVGRSIINLTNIIITAMSVVPINIPLLTTIILLTGVLAMAKREVIISNLSAIESLGRISVLCSDKTGTITQGEMTATRIYDAATGIDCTVTGLGYEPRGQILNNSKKVEFKDEKIHSLTSEAINRLSGLELIVLSGMLNNDSKLLRVPDYQTGNVNWQASGNPTEVALLTLFQKTGLHFSDTYENL